MYSAQYTTAVITVINISTAITQGLFTKFFPTQVSWLPGVIHHCLVCYSVWDSAMSPAPPTSQQPSCNDAAASAIHTGDRGRLG